MSGAVHSSSTRREVRLCSTRRAGTGGRPGPRSGPSGEGFWRRVAANPAAGDLATPLCTVHPGSHASAGGDDIVLATLEDGQDVFIRFGRSGSSWALGRPFGSLDLGGGVRLCAHPTDMPVLERYLRRANPERGAPGDGERAAARHRRSAHDRRLAGGVPGHGPGGVRGQCDTELAARAQPPGGSETGCTRPRELPLRIREHRGRAHGQHLRGIAARGGHRRR